MQDPGKGKAVGVFALGGVATPPTRTGTALSVALGGIKALLHPPSYTSAAMNPLLIFAVVGAAGEFHAWLQGPCVLCPGRDTRPTVRAASPVSVTLLCDAVSPARHPSFPFLGSFKASPLSPPA